MGGLVSLSAISLGTSNATCGADNKDIADCEHRVSNPYISRMKGKASYLSPADAGSGGPPRPGVGPVTPSAYHRAEPERSSEIVFVTKLEFLLTADESI